MTVTRARLLDLALPRPPWIRVLLPEGPLQLRLDAPDEATVRSPGRVGSREPLTVGDQACVLDEARFRRRGDGSWAPDRGLLPRVVSYRSRHRLAAASCAGLRTGIGDCLTALLAERPDLVALASATQKHDHVRQLRSKALGLRRDVEDLRARLAVAESAARGRLTPGSPGGGRPTPDQGPALALPPLPDLVTSLVRGRVRVSLATTIDVDLGLIRLGAHPLPGGSFRCDVDAQGAVTRSSPVSRSGSCGVGRARPSGGARSGLFLTPQ